MTRVVFIKGSIEVLRSGSKEYVRIYVYTNEGGKELTQYAGKEIKGFVVVENGSP